MLRRHPVATLVASVVAAAGVGAGVTYVLTSRRSENRAGSPMPMVTGLRVQQAETVIRSATGLSDFDVEPVSSAVAPEGTVLAGTKRPPVQIRPPRPG